MKILLIGERYSSNLGDCVICEVMEWLLKQQFNCEVSILDISGNTGYDEKNPSALSKKMFNFKIKVFNLLLKIFPKSELFVYKKFSQNALNYIEEYLNTNSGFDAAVFAGGQMLCNHFVLQIAKIIEKLSKNHTPIFFNSCGAGMIYSLDMINILKDALQNDTVISITTRDNKALIDTLFLKEIDKKAVVTYDPAIFAGDFYALSKHQSDTVGLGIMYNRNISTAKIISFWKNMITYLDENHIKWQLFCNGNRADYDLAEKILKKAGYENSGSLIAKRSVYPSQLVETISNYKSIISFRLHSHIIAYSLDIPSIAIVWDDKLNFYFKSIGYELRCKTVDDKIPDIVNELIKSEAQGYDTKRRQQQKSIIMDTIKGTIGRFEY